MKKKLIIIGGGGHARVLNHIIGIIGIDEVCGYTDQAPTGLSIPYLGCDDIIKKFSSEDILLVNGVGSSGRPTQREALFQKFKREGYSFHSLIHPKAVISSDVEISEGVQVMGGAIINTGVILGENIIINTGAIIDHNCELEPHTHIAPGVTLSGGCRIGTGSHIGTGATIIQNISIGQRSLIGAGAVVVKSIPPNSKAMGVPAKIVS